MSGVDSPRRTVTDPRAHAGIALGAFGPDRLMFGSDWPVCLPAASYAQVVAAVFAGTARHAYRLELP